MWYFISKSDVNFCVSFVPSSDSNSANTTEKSDKKKTGNAKQNEELTEIVHELDTVPANMVMKGMFFLNFVVYASIHMPTLLGFFIFSHDQVAEVEIPLRMN